MTSIDTHPLHVVYASVLDSIDGLPGATGDGATDDTSAIQRAIDTGLSVVFPGSTHALGEPTAERAYPVSRRLMFHNDNQRVIFLAGARLELVSSSASVHVTGKRQTFTGLWIHVRAVDGVPIVSDPCLLIEGAEGLVLEAPRVESATAAELVRVKDTDRVTIVGKASGIQFGGFVWPTT